MSRLQKALLLVWFALLALNGQDALTSAWRIEKIELPEDVRALCRHGLVLLGSRDPAIAAAHFLAAAVLLQSA